MLWRLALAACVLAHLTFAVPVFAAQSVPVSNEEARAWMRYLVPLPRSIVIAGRLAVDPKSVAVYPQSSADIVVNQAARELRESMGLPGGSANPSKPEFSITLQIGGADSAPLQSLRNSDQAYSIISEAGDSGLRIVALAPRGIYYGAKTLQQLIAARRGNGIVEMPVLAVTDWPQLRDRGVWGNDSFQKTRWMADRKMNYQEQIAARWFDNCVPHSGARPGYDLMHIEGPYYGLEPGHAVLHLEQHEASGIFTCFPNLKAVGNAGPGAWCYSQPEAVDVIAAWISDLNNLPYQEDVDVWMSENLKGKGGCKCAQCSLVNRGAMEARTIVAAWKKALQVSGPVGLRILTSEATRPDNQKIVEELQPDPSVKIWHYDSLVTYFVWERPIVDQYLQQWADAGRYLGEVPLLGPTSKCFQPWTCPQFVHYRAQEMKNKNISGVMGYPSPSISFYEFNVEAMAEWSWNPDGRSIREFAESWAVRQGLPDPRKFADWVEALGPVSWDVYGSEYPRGELRGNQNCGPIADALKNGTLQDLGQLKLGTYPAPWGDIRNLAQLNTDVAAAIKALDIAKTMNLPEFYYETLVIHGYITALRALYELKQLVVGGQVALENRAAAANYFYIYVSGLKQAKDALPKWELAAVGTTANNRVGETVTLLNDDISQMTTLASSLGCPISTSSTLVPVTSVPEAKRASDGTFATLGAEVVTSTENGVYIQEVGGPPIGIKLQTSLQLTPGQPAAVMGKLATAGGERVLNATMAVPLASDIGVSPLAVKTSDLGGAAYGRQAAVMEYRYVKENGKWVRKLLPALGLNNLGVLVRVAGRVTSVGPNYFYLDDGARCDDGSGSLGVRVVCGSMGKPAVGQTAIVTGVSSSYQERGYTWRALVLPSPSHIAIL